MAFETTYGADGDDEAVATSADDANELQTMPGLVFQSTRELNKGVLERQQAAILVHST